MMIILLIGVVEENSEVSISNNRLTSNSLYTPSPSYSNVRVTPNGKTRITADQKLRVV